MSVQARRVTGAALGAFFCFGCVAAPRGSRSALDAAVNAPPSFEVDGAPLCFVGANNYYLSYKPRRMVDDVLAAARDLGVKVVRLWAFIDRGSLDGQVKNVDGEGSKDGVYFQAWDPSAHHAVYNDGENGIARLDYAVSRAGELGLKVVLVLTNNWQEFGGMDQYLAWYGLGDHREFYRDAAVKQAYRDWAFHLVTRVNPITHRSYRDEPAIFAWELGNEPRADGFPPTVLTAWADEMSGYLKSLDPNHLVAVGDEGFLTGGGEHWTYRGRNGVDHRALIGLSAVDYGTFHMYPETWGTGYTWADRWIGEHERIAFEAGKPSVLEEYGLRVVRDPAGRVTEGLARRLSLYRRWNEDVLSSGGSGSMFWLLAGSAESGGLYPDYDHFTVYHTDESGALLSEFARRIASDAPACREPAAAHATDEVRAAPSPFVRVRKKARVSALGWRTNED